MSEAVVNGLAGAGGGIVAVLLTYPLQAVNTRQQTERKAKAGNIPVDEADALALAEAYPTKRPKGAPQEFWEIIKNEGWTGLYRGLLPSLIGTACSQGVYHYFYHFFRNEAETRAKRSQVRTGEVGSVGMLTSLFVAALAGCANVLVTNPIWVIVTRMQTQKQRKLPATASMDELRLRDSSGSYISASRPNGSPPKLHLGAFDTVKDLYKEAGALGFWKGFFPTLIMVSNPSIQFMIYEALLTKLAEKRTRIGTQFKHLSATEVFILSAVAKLGATVVTYPLLVVRSRLQAKEEGGKHAALHYTGTFDAVAKIIRFEGLGGLYKGMGTQMVQSVVAAAVLFVVKEELVKGTRRAALAKRPPPKAPKLGSSNLTC